MWTRMGGAWLVAALAVMLVGCSKSGKVPLAVKVPGHGELVLDIPAEWRTEILQLSGNFPPTINVSPSQGRDFEIRMTVLWDQNGSPAFTQSENVMRVLKQMLDKMMPSAVETSAELQPFPIKEGTGYYYTLTDKSPRPGDFTHVVQAGAGVGNLFVTATLLCRSKEFSGVRELVDALASARQQDGRQN